MSYMYRPSLSLRFWALSILSSGKYFSSHKSVLIYFPRIRWPANFQWLVDWVGAAAFDFKVFTAYFVSVILSIFCRHLISVSQCIVDLDLYQSFMITTLTVLFFFVILVAMSRFLHYYFVHHVDKPHRAAYFRSIFLAAAVYLIIFVYPTLSIKIVQALKCHDVEGTRYHVADYSLECSGARYKRHAAYTWVWIVSLVIGFPLWVLFELLKYRKIMLKKEADFDSTKYALVRDSRWHTQTSSMN